jgi:hypothetical protein
MDLEAAVKRAAPVRSGRLRASIAYKMVDDLTLKVGTGFTGTPLVYAAQVEFGGPIVPKNAKFLAWPAAGNANLTPAGVGGFNRSDVGGGGFIFARRVFQKGHPYLFPTVEAALPNVAATIGNAITKALGT